MASYYEEHDCNPLADGQMPDHDLHLARLLIDTGVGAQMDMEFERVFGGKKPSTAKKVIEELPDENEFKEDDKKCSICLKDYEKDRTKKLPCNHLFHGECIIPWLKMVNSCPICRHELMTDDPIYEEFKKQKQNQCKRDQMIEDLHNNMFG